MKKIFLCFLSLALAAFSIKEGFAEFPPDSLYQAKLAWTDNHGQEISLSKFAGSKVVITMAYTGCRFSCPLVVKKLKEIQAAAGGDKTKAQFVIATLDPERDTPEVFRAYMQEQKLDPARWHFLRGSNEAMRTLSMLLNQGFQKLPDSKDISHADVIQLLDENGRIVSTVTGLSGDTKDLVAQIAP